MGVLSFLAKEWAIGNQCRAHRRKDVSNQEVGRECEQEQSRQLCRRKKQQMAGQQRRWEAHNKKSAARVEKGPPVRERGIDFNIGVYCTG